MEMKGNPEFIMKLVRAQQGMGEAVKNRTNPHDRYRYADHAALCEAIMPAFNHQGLAILQTTTQSDVDGAPMVTCTTIITDGEGLWQADPVSVPVLAQGKRGLSTQSYGAAITYARRYSLMVATGVATSDTADDVDQSQQPPQQAQPGGAVRVPYNPQPGDGARRMKTELYAEPSLYTRAMGELEQGGVDAERLRELTGIVDEDSARAYMAEKNIVSWSAFVSGVLLLHGSETAEPAPAAKTLPRREMS